MNNNDLWVELHIYKKSLDGTLFIMHGHKPISIMNFDRFEIQSDGGERDLVFYKGDEYIGFANVKQINHVKVTGDN